MEFIGIDNTNALLLIATEELESIIKILKFTLIELQYEYSTRTGFCENETEELIKKLECAIGENKISITNQEILNLRQNLVEVLFGIGNMDFDSQFNLSKKGVTALYEVIDRYSNQNGAWN
jgi:hypothetical protein